MQDQLLAIERRLWTNDAAFYEAHLTDDALLIYLGKPALSRGMSQSRQSERRTPKAGDGNRTDIGCVRIGPDAALLTYRVSARWAHEASGSSALASSLYVRRDGSWKLAFHQQTPLPGVKPA
jgi:hypothetical protein